MARGHTRSARAPLDPGTEFNLRQLADECNVSRAAVTAVVVDLASREPAVSKRARATLDAWRTGSATAWRDLTLPTAAAETLTLTLGAWTPEPPPTPVPFHRDGYGVASGWTFNDDAVIAATRGVWRSKLPAGPARIVGFRYGLPVAHLWGEKWARDTTDPKRVYASKCFVSRHGRWVDVVTGSDLGPLDSEDQAVEEALKKLVVYPPGTQNPVSWLAKTGHRK